jgi:hypothetical protein
VGCAAGSTISSPLPISELANFANQIDRLAGVQHAGLRPTAVVEGDQAHWRSA